MKNVTQKFTGTVYLVSETTKPYKENIRKLVLTEQLGNRTNFIKFEAVGNQVELLNNIKLNDIVEVEYNLNGREWKKNTGEVMYFTDAHIAKLKIVKEFVPNLFDSKSVELPESNEFDNMENDFEND